MDEDIPGSIQRSAQLDPYQDIILAQIDGDLVGFGRISSIEEFETDRIYGLRGYQCGFRVVERNSVLRKANKW